MEVVGEDGSQIRLEPGQPRELGRSHGLVASDKTISRRHLSFFIPVVANNQEIHVQFEVLGRNPIYVNKNNQVKIFRRSDRGELENGDMFCVLAKNPLWYTMRQIQSCGEGVRRNDLESELARNLDIGFGFKGVDYLHQEGVNISDIDPVKEFGFVVIGHEFDSYPKKIIHDIKNLDWFLEEEGKDSGDDDDEGKKKGRWRKKRKKGTENDDEEEWTGENDDDKVLISKTRKAQRPKYTTRSKDPSKDPRRSTICTRTKNREVDDEDEEDDEGDDETLGGFIVDDENLESEEEIEAEDDEEEELVDEYDEDEGQSES